MIGIGSHGHRGNTGETGRGGGQHNGELFPELMTTGLSQHPGVVLMERAQIRPLSESFERIVGCGQLVTRTRIERKVSTAMPPPPELLENR